MTASGNGWRIEQGDVIERLRAMPDNHFHCCVTSPPYWGLRDYGVDGQIGLEKSLGEFIGKMTDVFSEVWRVLRDDGVLWVNMGDGYATSPAGNKTFKHGDIFYGRDMSGHQLGGKSSNKLLGSGVKPKDLLGQPWRLAFALQDAGWYLRQEIIWHKPAPMPESVRDRCTKAHEQIFLLTKKPRYYFDAEAVKVKSNRAGEIAGGNFADKVAPKEVNGNDRWASGVVPSVANLRSVWTLSPEPFAQAHFATFPSELPRRCILAGTSEHGCCAECGAPWVRQTESDRVATRPGNEGRTVAVVNGPYADHAGVICGNRDPKRHCTVTKTTGWQPSCQCNADVEPCRVLDPFSGAGTTVMVARRLHRHAVGIELNTEYLAMSAKRIREDAPLFN